MEFLIILFLLVLNGIFAMYEIALVSSSKARLETLVAKGNKSARGVLKQLEEPEKFLSTIQIGITLIGIGMSTSCLEQSIIGLSARNLARLTSASGSPFGAALRRMFTFSWFL